MPSEPFREEYPAGVMPQVLVQLETNSGTKVVLGDVDSGADRSLFPLEIAADLGIESELVEDAKKGQGAHGARFPTYSSSAAVMGQLVRIDGNGNQVLWGQLFRMRPAFADTDSFLLGRQDFFSVFEVRFLNGTSGPVLELRQ
jgi:hypothetical protein